VVVDVPLVGIEVDDLADSHLLSLASGRHERPPACKFPNLVAVIWTLYVA
jgi:hypothetical protein